MPYAELLATLQRAYVRVEDWSSRTSRFGRYRPLNGFGADLVVKTCDRWGPEEVRACVKHADAWQSLGEEGGGASVLAFVAWCPQPSTLVSEYIGGDELSRLLHDAGDREEESLAPLLRAIGALLGAIHRLAPSEEPTNATGAGAHGQGVWGAGDFAVYNFRLKESGEVVYLEPPAARRLVSRFLDLSWFLASLRAALGRRRRSLSGQLSRAFIEGYRGALEGHAWSRSDNLWLLLFLWRREALQALRRWRRRWLQGASARGGPRPPERQAPEAMARARNSGADSRSAS